MIEARHLTKRYGTTVAVDGACFAVRPGRVTGFRGPNGAGKSTTMRMILGLDAPGSSSVPVNGIAAALLGDPGTLMFDEPVNGLDPDGIVWIRNLMRSLAPQGRTVFLSSHLMSEMAQTAGHLLVIARGRIIADASTGEFVSRNSTPSVRVRALRPADLAAALTRRGAAVERCPDGAMVVTGLDSAAIGGAAAAHAITLLELATRSATLQEAFFDLTRDETDYHAGQLAGSSKGDLT